MAARSTHLGRKVLLGVAAVFGAVAVAVAVRLYIASPASWPFQEFSPAAWASTPRHERYRLYNDLARRRLLDHQPREAVTQFLGTPDYEAENGEYIDYVLIEWRPDNHMLNALYSVTIFFDAAGRISRYGVRHE